MLSSPFVSLRSPGDKLLGPASFLPTNLILVSSDRLEIGTNVDIRFATGDNLMFSFDPIRFVAECSYFPTTDSISLADNSTWPITERISLDVDAFNALAGMIGFCIS